MTSAARLLDDLLSIPAKGLTNVHFALSVDLAALGRGRLTPVRGHRDVAPALNRMLA